MNMNLLAEGAIPCKWCGTPTMYRGTKMCDGCWELESRIRRNPSMAERMLNNCKQEREQIEREKELNEHKD